MARQIKLELRNTKAGKIVVVTGAGHTKSLQEQLNAIGVNAKINTSMLQSAAEIKRYLNLITRERAAIARKDWIGLRAVEGQRRVLRTSLPKINWTDKLEVRQTILKGLREKAGLSVSRRAPRKQPGVTAKGTALRKTRKPRK